MKIMKAKIVWFPKKLSFINFDSLENKMEWDLELPFIMEKTVEEANGLIKKTTNIQLAIYHKNETPLSKSLKTAYFS